MPNLRVVFNTGASVHLDNVSPDLAADILNVAAAVDLDTTDEAPHTPDCIYVGDHSFSAKSIFLVTVVE